MALHMILGASGTGKSEYIYRKITQEADSHKDKRFFVIVPDQFTMQTQVDMVNRSGDRCGILNIDVLSFSRLAYRIYAETGVEGKLVLDDTGKNLILRKLAGEIKDEIPYIGANLGREGFVSEVKSVICEFMQYGVSPQDVDELIGFAGGKGALAGKLSDIKVIYEYFLRYIKDTYVTAEESMDVLASLLDRSKLIKESVVCLDGFTGFTPVQMKVLVKLMSLCEDVYVTLTLNEAKENCAKEELFWFTNRSYKTIIDAAVAAGIKIEKPIYCKNNYRFEGKPDMAYLEQNIFRYTHGAASVNCERISLYEAVDVIDEVRNLATSIRSLVSEGIRYKDIAVVAGNMTDYENHIEQIFSQFGIPTYIDKTHAIVMNPMVEYTQSLLMMLLSDLDRESVMRFLRSGISRSIVDDIDLFENYLLLSGIRGKKKYQQPWEYTLKRKSVYCDEEIMARVNAVREDVITSITPFLDAGIGRRSNKPATLYVEALYHCYVNNNLYDMLEVFRKDFEKRQEYTMEREYAQVYRLSVQLLEQVHTLLSDQKLTLAEFSQILEAGFAEITVGTIPQSVDKVIVGDIERSRLKPVKYLFFIGANDTAIPKRRSTCSFLSDMERERLGACGAILSPTPRERMYIQRFYLYNNLVKPSERLFLSYSLMSGDGTSIRPAYIIHMIENMFPSIKKSHGQREREFEDIYNVAELKEYISDRLRDYAQKGLSKDKLAKLVSAISLLVNTQKDADKSLLEIMINNSFFRYEEKSLEGKIAGILYGELMLASISRMEKYAECAYAYFLRYGLSLKERGLYSIDNREMGTIFHAVLEEYAREIAKRGMEWFDVDETTASSIIEDSLTRYIEQEGSILCDSKAGKYIIGRMSKVMHKSVDMLTYHLKAGEFHIDEIEMKFKEYMVIDEVNEAYDVQEKMQLEGRIDRIDTCHKDDQVYVKVIDYKTGTKDFSLINLYHGLQLQLVVYMSESIRRIKQKNKDKDVIPAAILYYHVSDDMVNVGTECDSSKIENMIRDELKMKGIVNDDEQIVNALDTQITNKSMVIPVGFTSSGEYTAYSKVLSTDDMTLLGEYARFKLRNIGNDIIKGKITKKPYSDGDKQEACTYCDYKDVCGFEPRLDGYEKSIFDDDKDTILDKMRQDMEDE